MKKALLFFVFSSTTTFAAVQNLTAKGGAIAILAKGKPSFIKIEGKGAPAVGSVKVDGKKIEGKFEFALTSLDTGIQTRNEHMKNKYLEVEKYPNAVLVITEVKSAENWTLQKPTLKDATFNGTLTLHGETKPVSGKFSINSDRAVEARFTLTLSQYKVAIPTFAGITVADDVDIDVKIDKLQ